MQLKAPGGELEGRGSCWYGTTVSRDKGIVLSHFNTFDFTGLNRESWMRTGIDFKWDKIGISTFRPLEACECAYDG